MKGNVARAYSISKFVNYSSLSSKCQSFLAAVSSEVEPTSYEEALKDPRWISVMQSYNDACLMDVDG